jgi:endo-1,4-beta-mannosidase
MKPLSDYSFIRGVCHGWYGDDEEQLYRELGYAKRLGINSTRCWLSYKKYWESPKEYMDHIVKYVRVSWEHGISTMPILWNGNMMDPGILEPSFWEKGDQWVKAVVETLKDEPGLIMWDVMNEPSCNDYLREAGDERPGRWDKMTAFLHHYCDYVKKLDPVNAITIGHTFVEDIEPSADCVDVISFHDYLRPANVLRLPTTKPSAFQRNTASP